MGSFARRPGAVRWLRIFLAAVCVLLVMLLGTVQAAHSHPGCADTHANCSLCVAAHVAVRLTQTQAPAPDVRVIARVDARPVVELPSRLSAFPHFTRPPPALSL